MNTRKLIAITLTVLISPLVLAQKIETINPNDVQIGPIRHQNLPNQLLKRIRATTDLFQQIDGINYTMAVDLYKRDIHPEENLVLFEEMAKAYKAFCKTRCATSTERQEVYQTLLLRTMFNDDETKRRSQATSLKPQELETLIKLYRLPPQPIVVMKEK